MSCALWTKTRNTLSTAHGACALVEGVTETQETNEWDNFQITATKKTKVNEERQTNRQRQGVGRGKRQSKGKRERETFFLLFFFFLGWADLTCLYRPRVKITLILSYTLTPSSAMNISFKCTAMGRRTGHYEMTFQFRFEVTYLGMWGKKTVCGHSCKDSVIHKLSKIVIGRVCHGLGDQMSGWNWDCPFWFRPL